MYEEYAKCLSYINSYWDKVIIKPSKDSYWQKLLAMRTKKKPNGNNSARLHMPFTFIVPNDKKFTHAFYWDTFFIFRGLMKTDREWVLKEMVNNFVYLFEKYGIIPNFSSFASTGRSQPPFFTSMILDIYNGYYFNYLRKGFLKKIMDDLDKHKGWLAYVTSVAKREYWTVWADQDGTFNHRVDGYGLNRYGDRDIGYAHSSELESGWDFTSRFYNRCDEFFPVDLNVYLFKYERDFAKIASHLEDKKEEEFWTKKSQERKKEINKLLWNNQEGFFFDYNYKYKRQSNFLSLAGFTPLWAGLATKDQVDMMVKKLPVFETDYGLVVTAEESLAPKANLSKIPLRYRPAIEEVLKPKQWDYPNIWPPLEYLTVVGLLKYGFVEHAKRIMTKSVNIHAQLFHKYGTFFEKIDGVKGDKPDNFHYETQTGFGWTNAIFYRYIQILEAMESGINIYANPKSETPPYKLSIVH